MIESPCIGVCELDDYSMTYCIGCFRDREGVARWAKADDVEKQAIVDKAEQLKEVLDD